MFFLKKKKLEKALSLLVRLFVYLLGFHRNASLTKPQLFFCTFKSLGNGYFGKEGRKEYFVLKQNRNHKALDIHSTNSIVGWNVASAGAFSLV
eukprot:23564_5